MLAASALLSAEVLETANFASGRALLAAAGTRNVVWVASDSRYYKDDIHPTAEGNRVLAAILASQIDSK